MAVTQPPAINAGPALPIQRNDRNTFSDRLDENIKWQIAAAPQMVAVAKNVADNATDAAASATSAANQAAIAAASAATATSVAGATMFVANQAYVNGASAISSIDYQTYRRRSAGSGPLDPKVDPANWGPVNPSNAGQLLFINNAYGGF